MPSAQTRRSIPAHLVIGAPRSGKTRLIRALTAQRPVDERWAVLVAAPGHTRLEPSDDGLVVREIDPGCLCCAPVTLRVEITRLLRSARPARLLVEAGGLAHAAQTIRLFADFWVAQAVTLHSVLLAIAGGASFATDGTPDADVAAALALADVAVIDSPGADSHAAVAAVASAVRPGRLVMPLAEAATDGRWRDSLRSSGAISRA